MSGMSGASMLRTRRKDVNLKPNRKLDRKSSRGMLFENEELRLRTININAEVERGQSDIKKLKRENDQLKREISALRYEYDRLDTMLRERRSSPEHSDNDSTSVCSACPECVEGKTITFNDLSVVPEEEGEGNRSGVESPCTCEECQPKSSTSKATGNARRVNNADVTQINNNRTKPNTGAEQIERSVDVLVHDTPIELPQFFQSITSPPYHVVTPPPPGFVLSPYQTPKFHNGGNVDDLLGDVQADRDMQTTYIQQNSMFMTKKVTQKQCCCQKAYDPLVQANGTQPKCYVTEKNIELTYDYPRNTPLQTSPLATTTEVASTVVFIERRIPVRPKKFDFFFRSRSAPVGENEEPLYATVNKLPKRLRRMELANLEKEVAYKTNEQDSSRTEVTKTDSEQSNIPHQEYETSQSEREKSVPQRPETPKTKKRKRFSLTFKKRERKRRDKKKEVKNGVTKNGGPVPVESESERLINGHEVEKHKHCNRHRPRNTASSSSSGPRYKRDSYQEMTTSHSEHDITNSMCSSMNSLGSACTHKSRKLSVPPNDGSIPWCGCWGAGCV